MLDFGILMNYAIIMRKSSMKFNIFMRYGCVSKGIFGEFSGFVRFLLKLVNERLTEEFLAP